MKTLPFTNIRSIVLSLAVIILCVGIGYRLGEQRAIPQLSGQPRSSSSSTSVAPPTGLSNDFSLFWNVWQKMFAYYIDNKQLDVQKMIYGAISGMVAAADDPYTSFFPPKENKEFKQDLGGEFEGIGAQLDTKDGRIIILSPLKKSPAEAAGLKPGDFILKVDGEDTAGWTVEDAVNKIRGKKGTSVTLTIVHEGERQTKDITVVRDTILVPSVESWVKPISEITEIQSATESAAFRASSDRIAYIKLSRFGDNTNADWKKAVDDIISQESRQSAKGLIFDMRYNPGGYLDGAVFIASEFLKSGTVVSQKNTDGSSDSLTVNRRGRLLDIPMVVLINKGSASAAEIVAGALRDYDRAIIVGETSFGKGTVQTPFELEKGSSVHITTGRWYLPKGDSIAKKGIMPDILVPMTNATATSDAQLAKAIEQLLK
jgi:carboxyl-terminal processing protease